MATRGIIGHIDADCFYVSCERVREPSLFGKPVGVLGNQGASVIARSYEMREYGIKTGTPVWEAKKVCPHAVYVKRDFAWYEVLSKQLWTMMKEVSRQVEYYSIDEFFFDASDLPIYFNCSMAEAVRKLQSKVRADVGVDVSIGISQSRTPAKLASDANKPYGTFVGLDEAAIRGLRVENPVSEICGIARRSDQKLASLQIRTCEDYVNADRKLIRRTLHKPGEDIYWELQGYAVRPILTDRPTRLHIARGGSLRGTVSSKERIEGWLARNVERLAEAMFDLELVASRVTLELASKHGGVWRQTADLGSYTSDVTTILRVVTDSLNYLWNGSINATHMHVVAGDLMFASQSQLSLFDPNANGSSITKLLKQATDKFGRFSIRHANTLGVNDMYSDGAEQKEIRPWPRGQISANGQGRHAPGQAAGRAHRAGVGQLPSFQQQAAQDVLVPRGVTGERIMGLHAADRDSHPVPAAEAKQPLDVGQSRPAGRRRQGRARPPARLPGHAAINPLFPNHDRQREGGGDDAIPDLRQAEEPAARHKLSDTPVRNAVPKHTNRQRAELKWFSIQANRHDFD